MTEPIEMSGSLLAHLLTDGHVVTLQPLLLGQARITMGPNREEIEQEWMYATLEQAKENYLIWGAFGFKDEPQGWVRHKPSYRRRKDGDPEQEEVRE